MNHTDHVQLIENGIDRNGGGVWADFGAGSGTFTLAVRDIAGPDIDLIAIDRDRGSLQTLYTTMERLFPGTRLRLLEADMAGQLTLPPLDGIVAANAIHFVRDQTALLRRWRAYLKPEGRLVVVEYDTDSGNRWAPCLQGNGTSRGVYRSSASWVETIPLAGADLQRADASDPENGCPITTSTRSVSVNERNELASPSQLFRAFQTSSAGQRRAHSGETNG